MLAYAGLPDVMKTVFERLRANIEKQSITLDEIRVHISQTLNSALPKKSETTHQMLCGAFDGKNLNLMKPLSKTISPVPPAPSP